MSRLTRLITSAIEHRAGFLSSGRPCRIFDGAGDGLDGLCIDNLGELVIVNLHHGSAADCEISSVGESVLSQVADQCGASAICLWRRSEQIGKTLKDGFKWIVAGKDSYQVKDGFLKAIVRPAVTPSAGLFLDTRSIREDLAGCKYRRVINLFCFTGTLGIAAALGGAEEVIQVDISKGALNWARENWALNSSERGVNMRFIPEDSRRFMEKEVRRVERGGVRSDLVIIDPPVFGTSDGKPFVLEQEISNLLVSGLRVLNPGGSIILTCNLSSLSSAGLADLADDVGYQEGFSNLDIMMIKPPSEDFTAPADLSHAFRGIKVRLD